VHEIKHDGYRLMVHKEAPCAGSRASGRFPAITEAAAPQG
jgi:hypothetical protein